jgi:hypothetical protein
MSANLNLERDGDPGDIDGLDVTGLVTRARDGQERVERAGGAVLSADLVYLPPVPA